jgi:hypothetical protein
MSEQEITVAIALSLWRSGNNGNAVRGLRCHFGGQLSAALGIQI